MPELPEVEHLRRTLEPYLLGRRVAVASLHRKDIAESFEPTKSGSLRHAQSSPQRLLQGATIVSLLRHGKQLAIVADSGAVLVVQLGMSGKLTCIQGNGFLGTAHDHAAWLLHHPSAAKPSKRGASREFTMLVFADPRRFGGLTTYPSVELLLQHRWSKLGPDALTITAPDLVKNLADTNRAIKAALLDQKVLAGVGNIYADEALFEAGMAPTTIARTIDATRLTTLAAALRLILGRAVGAGGSTLRNYVDASGRPGKAQAGHRVYGRAGQPCVRCDRPLRSGVIAQRTTVWCGICQSP